MTGQSKEDDLAEDSNGGWSICYLGDTLDGDGGADLAATARIRNGWMKFTECFPFLASRTPPLERA